MTAFTRSVYRVVKKIPKGKTMTYAEVATAIGKPNAYRSVANALKKNFNDSIPCHRVVRSDGTVSGYNRGGPRAKLALLRAEGAL